MDSESSELTSNAPPNAVVVSLPASTAPGEESGGHHSLSVSSATYETKREKSPESLAAAQGDSNVGNAGISRFSRLASGWGLRLPSISSTPNGSAEGASTTAQGGGLESFTKGLVGSSQNAVKAMQIKARHLVSQNKRRHQEGEFDLDMTYITENIIAMGFPAGDLSSGFFFGYVEGFYRNHMEEVIKFFETYHQGKYKVYNLCSERLYDTALFGGKVAHFPFDDHNCPPLQTITSFCHSAYSWLKEDILNVVVVHCKAGMARTGLMICSLLLFLKFFPTAEEVIDYYNHKRCVDGKGLILPSQIRYVKYFERILKNFNGENQPGRWCMLRGLRLHHCPNWIRPSITISNHKGVLFSTKKHRKTKDLMPEDFWISAPRKEMVVFALPGEPGLTELVGDFKIHFHDRLGDFYCWLNTTMAENRKILNTSDLDGFDKRKLPSPEFQVEIVMIDYNGTTRRPKTSTTDMTSNRSSSRTPPSNNEATSTSTQSNVPESKDKDDVYSDSEGEETRSSHNKHAQANPGGCPDSSGPEFGEKSDGSESLTHQTQQFSLANSKTEQTSASSKEHYGETENSDIKAIAADASVFTFGDEDYESE